MFVVWHGRCRFSGMFTAMRTCSGIDGCSPFLSAHRDCHRSQWRCSRYSLFLVTAFVDNATHLPTNQDSFESKRGKATVSSARGNFDTPQDIAVAAHGDTFD